MFTPSPGIEGGSPPPVPLAESIISRATWSNIIMISTKARPEGAEYLKPVVIRKLNIKDHLKSIIRFQKIMAEIPTQYCGVEDIYGRDTSIVHVTDYTRMADLYLSGANAPKGIPHPTEEQKVKFDEAVAIVEKWGSMNPGP
jgi:hypothetical protein